MATDLDAVRRLLAAGADPDGAFPLATPLMEVVDTVGYYGAVEGAITDALISAGADIHRRDRTGRTALHDAIQASPAAVGRLLRAGADPNQTAFDGSAPLLDLARVVHMYLDTAQLLLDFGADPNLVDEAGRTPIDIAVAEYTQDPSPEMASAIDLPRQASARSEE